MSVPALPGDVSALSCPAAPSGRSVCHGESVLFMERPSELTLKEGREKEALDVPSRFLLV